MISTLSQSSRFTMMTKATRIIRMLRTTVKKAISNRSSSNTIKVKRVNNNTTTMGSSNDEDHKYGIDSRK